MACGLCFLTAWVGGCVSGYMGVSVPDRPGAKTLSTLCAATLTVVTAIALDVLANFSMCGGFGILSLKGLLHALPTVGILGIIYSIAINYILKRYVFPSSPDQPKQGSEPSKPCCQKPPNTYLTNSPLDPQ